MSRSRSTIMSMTRGERRLLEQAIDQPQFQRGDVRQQLVDPDAQIRRAARGVARRYHLRENVQLAQRRAIHMRLIEDLGERGKGVLHAGRAMAVDERPWLMAGRVAAGRV